MEVNSVDNKGFIDPTWFLSRVNDHYENTRSDKYCESGIEVSEVIAAFGCAKGFTKGNAIKYLLRIINKLKRGDKVPDTDYFKLVHYIAMVWNLENQE